MKINVKVKPNSSRSFVEEKDDFYLVYVKSAPENNKANLEVVKLLAKKFGVSQKNVCVKFGKSNSKKIVEIIRE